jgi:hypothetical protein
MLLAISIGRVAPGLAFETWESKEPPPAYSFLSTQETSYMNPNEPNRTENWGTFCHPFRAGSHCSDSSLTRIWCLRRHQFPRDHITVRPRRSIPRARTTRRPRCHGEALIRTCLRSETLPLGERCHSELTGPQTYFSLGVSEEPPFDFAGDCHPGTTHAGCPRSRF